MRLKIFRLILVGFLFCAPCLGADNKLTLTLSCLGEEIRCEIKNEGISSSKINRRLSVGSEASSAELSLSIWDKMGKIRPLVARIRTMSATEPHFCWLSPMEFVGRFYEISYVARVFGLEPGEYKVRALYKNKAKLNDKYFDGELISNEILIIVRGP